MEMIVKPHRKSILAALALTVLAVPAAAHHSYAMFDMNRTVQLDAQVTKFNDFDVKSLDAGAGVVVFEQAGYIHQFDPSSSKTSRSCAMRKSWQAA